STRHHSDYHFVSGTWMHRTIDSWTARLADRVVVLSRAVRDHLVAREHVRPDHVNVIVQGFEADALRGSDDEGGRVRAELGLDDAFVVGAVASFQPAKGHSYLIDAVASLTSEIPNLKVLLVGGGDRTVVESLVHARGLGGRVVFAGFRRDVSACIRA